MANTITPVDAYALMNSIAQQATGRTDLTAVDTTTFCAVGETLLRTATENVLNAISAVVAKTIFTTRPYKGSLQSLVVAQERWGAQVRKIVNLMSDAEASTDNNTDLDTVQLDDGGSIDMYKIKKPLVLQLNIYGTKLLQKHITKFRDQLSIALHSEAEFMAFVDSFMTEFNNELEILNEAKTRATLINFMAGMIAMSLEVRDLVAEYNTEYGTTYTRGQLLSTYLDSFMKFVAATIKNDSNLLKDMSIMHHANLSQYAPIPRHTPKANQKMIMYEPIFVKAETTVYPTLFNPKYLDIGAFEGVNYWQSQKTPTAINCKPNILNVNNGQSTKASEAVTHDFVLGLLFDENAVGVLPQFDYTSTTPFNSAGGYYNIYVHERFNSYNDFTENAILYVLGEGGEVVEEGGGDGAGETL